MTKPEDYEYEGEIYRTFPPTDHAIKETREVAKKAIDIAIGSKDAEWDSYGAGRPPQSASDRLTAVTAYLCRIAQLLSEKTVPIGPAPVVQSEATAEPFTNLSDQELGKEP